ncbi:MAG TPA: hypothetical protein PKE12_12110 [Kiritimatiellia bacterium]|nr:hypothetical protein [Kiritimatiellia bacterium]
MKPLSPLTRKLAGWTLIALGVPGLVLPLVPATLFFAVGALLLAPYFKPFRRVSAWFHKNVPRLRGPLRRFRDFKQRHAHYTTIDSKVVGAENDLANREGRAQSAGDENAGTPR